MEQNKKEIITQSDVSIAEHNYKSAENDLVTQKNSFVSQIQSKIDSLNDSIKSLESSKSKLETALKNDKSNKDYEELTEEKLRNEAIISINNEIDNINSSIISLRSQLLEIDESINNSVIKATLDGTVTLINELNIGAVVQAGSSLCSIIPSDNALKVVLYIPEKEISKIEIGQETEYIIDAMPYNEYGRIKGTIISISADSITNEASATKLYIAQASLNSDSLTNSAGETRYVKNGMIVDAKAICGTKKVITWLLQKINFID